jgi:hypothetical protein
MTNSYRKFKKDGVWYWQSEDGRINIQQFVYENDTSYGIWIDGRKLFSEKTTLEKAKEYAEEIIEGRSL